jgi:hypothetical protein
MSAAQANSSDAGKEFSCPYCQRSFRRLEHLQRHTRRRMFSALAYCCSTNSYNLDTNEKPFSCPCGASFSRRDLLRRHERVSCHLKSPNDSLSQVVNGTRIFLSDHSDLPHTGYGRTPGYGNESQHHAGFPAYQPPPSLSSSTNVDSFT